MTRPHKQDVHGCGAMIGNRQCGLPIEEYCGELIEYGKTTRVLVGYCWKHRHSIPVCKGCDKGVRNPEHEAQCMLKHGVTQ